MMLLVWDYHAVKRILLRKLCIILSYLILSYLILSYLILSCLISDYSVIACWGRDGFGALALDEQQWTMLDLGLHPRYIPEYV